MEKTSNPDKFVQVRKVLNKFVKNRFSDFTEKPLWVRESRPKRLLRCLGVLALRAV